MAKNNFVVEVTFNIFNLFPEFLDHEVKVLGEEAKVILKNL